MDLVNFSTENEHDFVVAIDHPVTGEPMVDEKTGTPVTVTLIPRDSAEFQRVQKALTNRQLKKAVARGEMQMDADEVRQTSLDLLVAQTKAWSGVTFKGQTLDCTPDNARLIYESVPFFKEQVQEAASERANFLGNSLKTS